MNSSDNPSARTPSRSSGWRLGRRLLLALAAAVTLVVLLYTFENWRGKRAWEARRRQLEAQGETLDWAAFIPPPVPDNQNFFDAPDMEEWFVKDSRRNLNGAAAAKNFGPQPFALAPRKEIHLVVAEVKVIPRAGTLAEPAADAVWQLEDPGIRQQAAARLAQALGPCALGARQSVLLSRPVGEIKPLHFIIQTASEPSLKELAALFPAKPVTSLAWAYSQATYFRLDRAGNNSFSLSIPSGVYGAADYLAWTEPLTASFEEIRRALERPYARINCDYQQPYAIGIPDFVRMREIAQILSERAQCYLLLGRPEEARHELSLVHDLCRILLAKPSGRPITLVAAMINVAICGLYADIIEDGLRLHAWREPQLQALESQLQETDLLPPVAEAFREERAATCWTFETISRNQLVKLFNAEAVSKVEVGWMPRGWFYQNMALGAQLTQEMISSWDSTNQIVEPGRIKATVAKWAGPLARPSPYTFLVALSYPNFAKAIQTTTRNQTLLNQAQIGCALEHDRLAQGHFPDTLEDLAARLGRPVPHDLVGGHPLKYRRTGEQGYLLYSIGWDEKDDGGLVAKSVEDGDWVWSPF